jgi:uncharacterized protein (DUF433 family)
MPLKALNQRAEPWRSRLYLPAYTVADSARYARTTPQTVARWYFGGGQLGPALAAPGRDRKQPGREPRAALSYLQLVEVAFVATFRRLGISLQRIRVAREYAATVLKSEYPFAELRWKTEGVRLLLTLRDFDEPVVADTSEIIVADLDGQTAWGPMLNERFMQFEYGDNLAMVWHVRGMASRVLIDPRVAFGAPMISGIPTWVVKGRYQAGEGVQEIAADFGLDYTQVSEALMFEGIDGTLSAA